MPGNDYKIVWGNWDILGVSETIWVMIGTYLGETGNELGGKPGSCCGSWEQVQMTGALLGETGIILH